jgi:tRNA threonylcarbamoyladenosine biosynthesis protein TsaB
MNEPERQRSNQCSEISLVVDASNPAIFTGILDASGKWLAQSTNEGMALEVIFPAIEKNLHASEIELAAIDRYLYCEGPGSTLGLRLVAMALETWRRLTPKQPSLHSYNSLQFVAACLQLDAPETNDALIVADWKKDAWNAVYIRNQKIQETAPIEQAELDHWEGARFHLPQRKGWQAPPANATTLHYDPTRLPEVLDNGHPLRSVDSVELFASAGPSFQKWTPDRHRAPQSTNDA